MHHSVRTLSVLLFFLCASGCAPALQGYRVRVATSRENVATAVARALTESSIEIARNDAATGTVESVWQDTRYLYGQVEGTSARLVRRYISLVTNRPPGVEVLLRVEERRCASTAYTVINGELQGRCEAEPEVPQPHRAELDALGERMRAALGSNAVRVTQ